MNREEASSVVFAWGAETEQRDGTGPAGKLGDDGAPIFISVAPTTTAVVNSE